MPGTAAGSLRRAQRARQWEVEGDAACQAQWGPVMMGLVWEAKECGPYLHDSAVLQYPLVYIKSLGSNIISPGG